MAESGRSVDVRAVYDAEYFLKQVDGAHAWAGFNGDPATLYPRARRNLELLGVRSGERMLEIGCGRGEAAMAAAWLGASVVAVDYAEPALELARRKLLELRAGAGRALDVEFVLAVATDLHFPPASFDKVLMAEFIEHVSLGEGEAVLRAVRRWLRPRGRLLVYTYPNRLARRFWPIKRLAYRLLRGAWLPPRMADTEHPHYHAYHLNEQSWFSLRRRLRGAGFTARVWFDMPCGGTEGCDPHAPGLLELTTMMNLTAVAEPAT